MSSDAYVVFTNDRSNWWSPFLKKNIKHCYVVIPYADRLIQHGKLTDQVELFTKEAKKGIIGDNNYIAKFKRRKCKRHLFMLNTCVGHTKQILGINNPFILTPYQLLKYMRKYNGQ